MKHAWLAFAGLLAISCFLLLQREDLFRPDSESDISRNPRHSPRTTQATSSKATHSAPKVAPSKGKLKSEATRLLLELGEAKNYSQTLLEFRLSSLFQQWGAQDIEAAEQFLDEEDAAQGSTDGLRRYREDLVLAAWIGYASADPIDAWTRFSKAWLESGRELVINPALRPLPHETAAYHIFKSCHKKDPSFAHTWLHNRDKELGPLFSPALQAVMAGTESHEERQRLFEHLCQGQKTVYVDISTLCAGVAEQDPEQAWEFILSTGAHTDGPLTPESRESIAGEMIRYWSIRQPEQALRFVLSPERLEIRLVLLEYFILTQFHRRPDLVIQALDHKEPAHLKHKFHVTLIKPLLLSNHISWPLTDDVMIPSPEERIRTVEQAVRASSLPETLKNDILAQLTP